MVVTLINSIMPGHVFLWHTVHFLITITTKLRNEVFGPGCHQLATSTVIYTSPCRYLKAELYTIVPRSPFFSFLYSKILPVTKMRLNVCFNEMALFGLFVALIKGCSSCGRNGGQPTRRDS